MKRLIFTLLVMALVTGCSSDDMLNDIQNNTKYLTLAGTTKINSSITN